MESGPGTIRITHVITGLRPHGAELALLRLVRGTRRHCEHTVVVLTDAADLSGEFEDAGASVVVGGISRRPDPRPWWRVISSIQRSRPDVVQTWLPAADLLGGLAGRLVAHAPVVWNIRHSEHDPNRWGRHTRMAIAVNSRLSRWIPRRIIAVGSVAAALHRRLGYDPSKIVVIHNGFDPVPAAGEPHTDRERLGLRPEQLVVSRLCRYHADKDIPTLIHAWSIVQRHVPHAVLALAGHDLAASTEGLTKLLQVAGVERSVVAFGHLADPAPLYRASDVTVSSSLAEGLPNVIGEAMAHAVPAVVTNAGDSAALVADTGRVVPCSDPEALAWALIDLLRMPASERRQLGSRAQQRIVTDFSMEAMATRYVALWRQVADVRD